MSFDYRYLSPIEFERLCSDLLEKLEGVRYQQFGEGRDDGIDLLNDDPSSGRTIVQCKRYRDTSKLIQALKKHEVSKVRKIKPKPKRYCLLTSASLTPKNKQEIQTLFKPFILTTQDIWGREDLDQMLSQKENLSVVYNVPSLWLPSFNLVSDFMNNAIRGRSITEIEETLATCSSLAWTSVCDFCMERLESSKVAILVGDPGIGKTVTADMLIARLYLMGYEVYVSYDGIKEFESVYKEDVTQAFLYDDFLGSNYFEAIQNHEDSQICQFIKRVSRNPTKRFILTSRTTILNRGIECSTAFKIHGFEQDNYRVDINKVSVWDKAHILFKLLRSSCCNDDVLVDYVRDKLYWNVIRHSNYNPRVIAYILRSEEIKSANGGRELASMLDDALRNPMKTWGSVFENQIDRVERVLVWMVFLHWRINETQLIDAFDKMLLNPSFQINPSGSRSFASISQTLVGSLLKRIVLHERSVDSQIDELLGSVPHDEGDHGLEVSTVYELQNHSIADYLSHNWEKDTASVKLALELLDSKAALEDFINMTKELHCPSDQKRSVLRYLTSGKCSAKSAALRLRAYAELVGGQNDSKDCQAAFEYVRNLDVALIDRQGADSFVQILKEAMDRKMPVNGFLESVPAEDIWKIFTYCDRIQSAVALVSLSPSSVFSDTDALQEVISDRLVKYGHMLLDSWDTPELEPDEDTGWAHASDYDIKQAEDKLEKYFIEVLADARELKNVIDVWKCVEDVDVAGSYETEYEPETDSVQRMMDDNSDEKQIDALFSNLTHD